MRIEIKRTGRFPFVAFRNLERPPKWLDEALGVTESATGVNVTEENSLKFSAVWSAVNLLSTSVAILPAHLFRREGGGKVIERSHPVYRLIHESPNEKMTAFTFKQTLMTSVLLWGNAYVMIAKDKDERPVSLSILHPADVIVMVKEKVWYKVSGRENLVPSRNMIHVMGFSLDGVTGKSPIQVAKDAVGLGMAAERFGGLFFKQGANSELALEVPASLTDEQYTRLKNSFSKRAGGLENSHSPMILEGGMKAQQLTIPPDQAQFIQTRNFQINEIARIFNVPPHMIGDLERSTNNNIEQQSIQYVQYSLMPWVKRIEEELTRKLLYEAEKPDYFIEFNMDGLLRGDAKARSEYYRTLWNIGAINNNEIRSRENMNPYEGGDEYFVPVNTVPLSKLNEVQDQTGAAE